MQRFSWFFVHRFGSQSASEKMKYTCVPTEKGDHKGAPSELDTTNGPSRRSKLLYLEHIFSYIDEHLKIESFRSSINSETSVVIGKLCHSTGGLDGYGPPCD